MERRRTHCSCEITVCSSAEQSLFYVSAFRHHAPPEAAADFSGCHDCARSFGIGAEPGIPCSSSLHAHRHSQGRHTDKHCLVAAPWKVSSLYFPQFASFRLQSFSSYVLCMHLLVYLTRSFPPFHLIAIRRCFVVHDKKQFVDKILSLWFRQSKWASFQRQLNMYGFKRLSSGPDKGGKCHS